MTNQDNIEFSSAGLEDQGLLGKLLIDCLGTEWQAIYQREKAVCFDAAPAADELMAADDFYFSSMDLMDCCFLAKKDNTVVGAVCINPYISEIQFIAVDAKWRRQGIGTKLLQLALEEMAERGCNHTKVDIFNPVENPEAVAFFGKAGFAITRQITRMGKAIDK